MWRATLAITLMVSAGWTCNSHEQRAVPRPASASSQTLRSPQKIRRLGNHLKGARSLYLRQHAHNPVDWYPWGERAIQRARKENRPIFLSIGYASCHWCHVMEREVFERDQVAALLNQHFVAIKVDREERPDLDAAYMKAVQAMTGSGGWPLSVFLTPDLKPFYGGTYFPLVSFVKLLEQVHDLFTSQRNKVDRVATQLRARLLELQRRGESSARVDQQMLDEAAGALGQAFDDRWGGVGRGMKFPTPPRWSALLHHYRKTGQRRWASMVRKTLDAIASGGIHDHLGGGFHRYATDPEEADFAGVAALARL